MYRSKLVKGRRELLCLSLAAVLAFGVGAVASASSSAAKVTIQSGAGPGWPSTISSSDFVRHVDNRWFPLVPGSRYVYRGRKDNTRMVDVLKVTHKTKSILGVRTTVVHDEVLMHGRP